MLPHFYYHSRMLGYDFGPQHPLKPERLRLAMELLEHFGVEAVDPGEGRIEDVLRVHSPEYVDAVSAVSARLQTPNSKLQTGPGLSHRAISTHQPPSGEFQTPNSKVQTGSAHSPPAETTWPEEGGFGFGPGDNPPFAGMFEASLAYVAGTARAAEAVRDGAPRAFGLAGGLHHAHRDRASGFCIFNDPAVAIHILRERFARVAYVDIDVHHGDGVQWLYYHDPSVLTCSIHEDPRTLFPGTGFVEESRPWTVGATPSLSEHGSPQSASHMTVVDGLVGATPSLAERGSPQSASHMTVVDGLAGATPSLAERGSPQSASHVPAPCDAAMGESRSGDEGVAPTAALNAPLAAGTTGDVWLWAFENAVMPALVSFAPQAIVLQMGTDSHFLDPLAHIRNTAQEWLEAVRMVRDFGVPMVAVGGGGYETTCVPRMWAAACLTLGRVDPHSTVDVHGDRARGGEPGIALPAELFDPQLPQPRDSGRSHAERVVAWLSDNVL